jgi:hypothetical protein
MTLLLTTLGSAVDRPPAAGRCRRPADASSGYRRRRTPVANAGVGDPLLRPTPYTTRVELVRSPDGSIAAAWTTYQDGRFVVQAAQLSGYRFGSGQTVSDAAVDSVLADLDAGPSSELAVLWRTGVAGNDPGRGPAGLQAALRDPGAARFGAAEQVEQGTAAQNATLRFDPSTRRAIAAWDALGMVQTAVRAPLSAVSLPQPFRNSAVPKGRRTDIGPR